MTDGYFIDYQEITFYGIPEVFKVPLNFEQLQQVLKHEAKKAKQAGHWYEFFNLKNTYADFRPNHASTVHKSQGSTYSNVCIDLTDIGLNNKPMEVARLLYVGITRAKHKLYLYGELPDKYKGI